MAVNSWEISNDPPALSTALGACVGEGELKERKAGVVVVVDKVPKVIGPSTTTGGRGKVLEAVMTGPSTETAGGEVLEAAITAVTAGEKVLEAVITAPSTTTEEAGRGEKGSEAVIEGSAETGGGVGELVVDAMGEAPQPTVTVETTVTVRSPSEPMTTPVGSVVKVEADAVTVIVGATADEREVKVGATVDEREVTVRATADERDTVTVTGATEETAPEGLAEKICLLYPPYPPPYATALALEEEEAAAALEGRLRRMVVGRV